MSRMSRLRAAADKTRARIDAKGGRDHTVTLRAPGWTGKDSLMGTMGTQNPSDTPITPNPSVKQVSLEQVQLANGVIEAGDLEVSQITRTLSQSLILAKDTIWVIAGPQFNGEFSLVGGRATLGNTCWTAILTRRQ